MPQANAETQGFYRVRLKAFPRSGGTLADASPGFASFSGQNAFAPGITAVNATFNFNLFTLNFT